MRKIKENNRVFSAVLISLLLIFLLFLAFMKSIMAKEISYSGKETEIISATEEATEYNEVTTEKEEITKINEETTGKEEITKTNEETTRKAEEKKSDRKKNKTDKKRKKHKKRIKKRKKGFVKERGKKYYYLKNGKKAKGFRKIKNEKYYFNSKGVMQYGLKKIKGNIYYFKKSGKMYSGFLHRKYHEQIIRNYFGKDGKLKTGTFQVGKVVYKAKKKSGEIYYVNNKAPVICQRPQLPTGCEITAWTMMVSYAGKKMNKIKAANIMPRSWNPNYGFMGSPYSTHGRGLVVYPNGLSGITRRYLGRYENMSGCSYMSIRKKLRKGHLVLVWLCGLNGFGSHTVTLTGYDQYYVYYNNPWTGMRERLSYSYFYMMWRWNGKRAMSY